MAYNITPRSRLNLAAGGAPDDGAGDRINHRIAALFLILDAATESSIMGHWQTAATLAADLGAALAY